MAQHNTCPNPRDFDTRRHETPSPRYDSYYGSSGQPSFLSSTCTNPPSPRSPMAMQPDIRNPYGILDRPPYYSPLDGSPITGPATGYTRISEPLDYNPYAHRRGFGERPGYSEVAGPGALDRMFMDQPKTPSSVMPLIASHSVDGGLREHERAMLPELLQKTRQYPCDPPCSFVPDTVSDKSTLYDKTEQKNESIAVSNRGPVAQRRLETAISIAEEGMKKLQPSPVIKERGTKTAIDLQDTRRQLDKISQDRKMSKDEADRQIETRGKRWCTIHLAYDLCVDSVRQETSKQYPDPIQYASQTSTIATSSATPVPSASEIPALNLDNETSKARAGFSLTGRICTDPNRFIDFAERQRAARALGRKLELSDKAEYIRKQTEQKMRAEDRESRRSHREEFFRAKAQMGKECERLLAESKLSEIVWRTKVEKVTKELEEIEKKVPNNSAKSTSVSEILPISSTVESPGKTTFSSDVPGKAAGIDVEQAVAKCPAQLPSSSPEKRTPLCNATVDSTFKTREDQATVSDTSVAESHYAYDAQMQEKTTSRSRTIASVLRAVAAEVEADANWDRIELSDDEDWENVEADVDWEVLRT
ncbi:hypothetical protein N0V94_007206 [Neodidymelliopsis sp. IMI 364377]|nr:hypothetical protein N0V94_007206 [Neodidymelliopsis sp. IMI 364377]